MKMAPRIGPRAAVLFQGLALLVLLISSAAQEAPRSRPAPRFEGSTIPEPPRQHEPWVPPGTSLPKFMTRASAALFEQGLADPRGGDYRAIEIVVGNVWSKVGGVVATHGWVLPETPGETTRFAVTWSGLVYPTVSVGGPADLEADTRALEDAAREVRRARAERPGWGLDTAFGGFHANDEAFSVSLKSLHPIKVSLLLRLGRADLAERVWAAATGRPREELGKAKFDLTHYGVSYLTMANDLAWYHFDRAVCAHMRGDDAVALADARRLTAFAKAVETKAQAMGFARPQPPGGGGDAAAPYIGFLEQLPELLADHDRRARGPKRPPMPPPAADKKARIAALIANLDQVSVTQFGQPGGVNLGEDATVKALVAEGDDAVEPLIQALETEDRLTRSVHFHRDFGRSRTIMGAHEAVYTALSGILKTSFFGAASTGDNLTARGAQGRKAVADRVRAYWQKNRDVPLVERWYRTLADDVAAPAEWLQAAGNIVQSENVAVVPGSTAFTTTVITPLTPGARPRLRGEALREKKDPSIAELLAMRVRDIDPGGPIDRNSPDQFKVFWANQMAELLALWDGKAARPVLKARVGRCALVVQAAQQAGARVHGLEDGIAKLTELRLDAGDPDALNDYAAWARTATPDHFDFPPTAMFAPLWRNPDHPAVIAAAEALFGDPKSPWNPTPRRGNAEVTQRYPWALFTTPLLGLKPFRVLVARALSDATQVGTVETDARGRVIVIEGNTRTVSDADRTDEEAAFGGPDAPGPRFRPGPSALPLRVADKACEQLQTLEGIPRFQKQWPLAQRDEAIGAVRAYLERYGERFREGAVARAIHAQELGGARHEQALLTFDRLDRPATAADVKAGRAIFSLAGDGAEVRRVALPLFPTAARWTKLKVFPDDPPIVRTYDAAGRAIPDIAALQAGRAWQAEELRDGESWRRYYGFVGRHALTRVPAEEIEFPAPWGEGWSPLTADLDGRVVVSEGTTAGPLPLEVSFRNHRGVNTMAPTDLVRTADGVTTLREGVVFRLVRVSDTSDTSDPLTARGDVREQRVTNDEVPIRALRRHGKGAPPRALAPGEVINAMQSDLRTLFPVDRPGLYRIEVTFDDLTMKDGSHGKITDVFTVSSRATDAGRP